MIDFGIVIWVAIGFFLFGLWLGGRFEARIWRDRGDHKKRNRLASGGRLYIVRWCGHDAEMQSALRARSTPEAT